MIVPMKKVYLIISGDENEATLKKLRKLGLLHIETAEGSGLRLGEIREQIALLESSIFTVSDRAEKNTEAKSATPTEALAIARKIASLSDEIKRCNDRRASLEAELERLSGWGAVDPESLTDLARGGVDISLYEMPLAEYNGLNVDLKALVFNKSKVSVKFLLIKSELDGEADEIDALNAYRVELPQISTAKIREKIEKLETEIEAIEQELTSYAHYLKSMKSAVTAFEKELEFETYAVGMSNERLSVDAEGSVSVTYLKGYIEAENACRLSAAARENSWGLLIEEPCEEDDVPTKLKNNRFVSLIYPLTDFLGTVPGYFEYDISGWFLGFILIFFGIIFGDGGYGLLISAVSAIPIIRSLAAKKAVPPAFLLMGLFGLSTVIWGTLTCTWFGIPCEQLPVWLRSLSVPVISNVYSDKLWYPPWTNGTAGLTTAQNLQIFCFSLALVQLTAAHVKGALRNRKTLKMLGDIGSILQLMGIYYVVLSLVVNARVFSFGLVIGGIPIGTVAVALVAIGFLMSFIFSNYEGSIADSVLSSLKNIVSVLLGVVNVFSDIVSYIRLWAVGLAGAAISATVNELAGPLLGNFMFTILAIILLVFGHGLNMILNVLSVIVHGIRLNTLEFSSHLDMSWSGHKFKPFEE